MISSFDHPNILFMQQISSIQYQTESLKTCIFFFERQIWITDGLLEYHRVTSRTTRSYPSPLDNNVYTPIQEETQ
ncbi:hypothetical protein Hanom_Chr11g00970511 [Helianthus anomalus]